VIALNNFKWIQLIIWNSKKDVPIHQVISLNNFKWIQLIIWNSKKGVPIHQVISLNNFKWIQTNHLKFQDTPSSSIVPCPVPTFQSLQYFIFKDSVFKDRERKDTPAFSSIFLTDLSTSECTFECTFYLPNGSLRWGQSPLIHLGCVL
jgi:hypothetical protein